MKPDKLLERLIELARRERPSAAVPYAFEKRIMARLRAPGSLETWQLWNRMLWRAAVPCVALMLTVTAVSLFTGNGLSDEPTVVGELEQVVYLPISTLQEAW